jgi:hypothetical protein
VFPFLQSDILFSKEQTQFNTGKKNMQAKNLPPHQNFGSGTNSLTQAQQTRLHFYPKINVLVWGFISA